MFEQISNKLQGVFKKLRGQARLKEEREGVLVFEVDEEVMNELVDRDETAD